MSQTKTTTSSPSSSINPVLKAALNSLDLNLEAELRRYQDYKRKKLGQRNNQVITLKSPDKTTPKSDWLEQVASLVHQPQPNQEQLSSKDSQVPPPEDYLESSERLLRSLAEGELFADKEQPLLNPVATPLGISSIFIFLLAAALFSLAFMPTEILTKFPVLASLTNNSTNLAEPTPEASSTPVKETLPQSPNLAATEFVDLNLQNLSIIEANQSSKTNTASPSTNKKPEATAAERNPQKGLDLNTALIPPSLNQVKVPPKNAAKIKTSGYYYVLAGYNGDESLAKARKIVDDAYVWQFPQGKRIQLGAFYYQTEADQLVAELKAKGISTSIYHPEH